MPDRFSVSFFVSAHRNDEYSQLTVSLIEIQLNNSRSMRDNLYDFYRVLGNNFFTLSTRRYLIEYII